MGSCAYRVRLWWLPRSTRACRSVGNARKRPSSVRWVTFAIIAAYIRGGQRLEERQVAPAAKPAAPGAAVWKRICADTIERQTVRELGF
jgi:hypothetical protein